MVVQIPYSSHHQRFLGKTLSWDKKDHFFETFLSIEKQRNSSPGWSLWDETIHLWLDKERGQVFVSQSVATPALAKLSSEFEIYDACFEDNIAWRRFDLKESSFEFLEPLGRQLCWLRLVDGAFELADLSELELAKKLANWTLKAK